MPEAADPQPPADRPDDAEVAAALRRLATALDQTQRSLDGLLERVRAATAMATGTDEDRESP